MKFGDIIFLILVIVVAGIILNLIFNPNSLEKLKDNIPKLNFDYDGEVDYIKIDMGNWIYRCSSLDLGAEAEGISKKSIKKNACMSRCSQDNLRYSKFDCNEDKLICYCIN